MLKIFAICSIFIILEVQTVSTMECSEKLSNWQYYFSLPFDCTKKKEEKSGCWGEWSSWSNCNSPISCGNCGQRQRLRKCENGDKCKGSSKEVSTCGEKICKIGAPCCSGNHLAYSTKNNFYCEADD